MLDDRKTELLDEIRQLLEQYRREVPSHRRAWPESIKNRVLGLRGEGLNIAQIAKHTGLAYYTVLKWHHEKKPGSFEQMNIVPRRAPKSKTSVIEPTPSSLEKVVSVTEPTFQSQQNVTVSLPSGIRIEGLNLKTLLELLPRLGLGIQ